MTPRESPVPEISTGQSWSRVRGVSKKRLAVGQVRREVFLTSGGTWMVTLTRVMMTTPTGQTTFHRRRMVNQATGLQSELRNWTTTGHPSTPEPTTALVE